LYIDISDENEAMIQLIDRKTWKLNPKGK